ncbi:MAG: Gfo/Idh/MocA family oxidoreductase [Clostridia bacterium]|nr:Gfo/Idh/MocA family oxidoreductase [Clostridia bacterium]
MKYATIGTSWITEKFISAANTVPDMNLTAIYSRDEKKAHDFAAKHGAKLFFTDLTQMAQSTQFEAVYIASPNVCHYEQSKLLLSHGKNVICEKPATTTKKQMEELIAIAEKNNLIYCEAIMTIHADGFNIIRKKLQDLGKIRSAHFDFYQLSSKYQAYTEGKKPNIFNPDMHTGCLMDIGVYNLYLAAALFGRPTKIISDAVKLPNDCDAAGSAILKYENLSVTLNYSKVGQTYSYSEIIGDKGTLMFSSVSQLTGVYFKHKEISETLVPEEVSRDEIMSGEIRFFLNMCTTRDFNNTEYLFSKNTALTVREICDTIRKDNGFCF